MELGAKMVDFHGWNLPLEYSGALKEYKSTREKSGLFDISHMGRIFLEGSDASRFLQHVCTNNIKKLNKGRMLYTLACDESAHILDDFMVYRLDNKYMCAVNASNREKIYKWFNKQSQGYSVKVHDESDRLSMIAFQGPLATDVISKFLDISSLFYLEVKSIAYNESYFIVSRSGYTGEDGFEIIAESDKIIDLWSNLLLNGKDQVFPCGLAVRDMLRLEMGYSLYGSDIDEGANSIEAGLGWAIDFDCGDFIGKDILQQTKDEITSRLVGFKMLDRAVPRAGYEVFNRQEKIGIVTSGGFSPSLDNFIGIGYIKLDLANEGSVIEIKIRDNLYKAQVTSIPFIRSRVKRRKPIKKI